MHSGPKQPKATFPAHGRNAAAVSVLLSVIMGLIALRRVSRFNLTDINRL